MISSQAGNYLHISENNLRRKQRLQLRKPRQGLKQSYKPSFPADKPEAEITLKECLEQIIEEIKNPSQLKPSASYQGYLTLLHKLEVEGKLIKQPLSTLGDDSFVQLIRWLGKHKRKNGRMVKKLCLSVDVA